jgi:hypothetical protein
MALFGPVNQCIARPQVETSGNATIAPLSPAPVTPRRTRIQPSTTLLTPKQPLQRASPRHVRAQPAEYRSGSQSSSQVTSMTQDPIEHTPSSSTRPRSRPLPAHYFGPNPIVTPDQLSQTFEHAPDGPYFLIMQGLEPGMYKEWYVLLLVHFWLLICPGTKWLVLRKMFRAEFGRKGIRKH